METETERRPSLWRHPNFLKLWTSDTISQFGTQFSGYAIPFTALLLTKDPLAFSILNVSAFIGFPLFALFIGVYVDRHRRQRIMTLAKPLLILHGENDTITPLEPVKKFSAEAEKLGLPVQLAITRDEGHGSLHNLNTIRDITLTLEHLRAIFRIQVEAVIS